MSERPGRSRGVLGTVVLLAIVIIGGVFAVNSGTQFGSAGSSESRDRDSTSDSDSDSSVYPPSRDAVIDRVVDGDTIVVRIDGRTERVRLLNIDTPESVDPNRPVECLGPAASEFLSRLLPVGTPVRLDYDLVVRDRFDRMLAGVSLKDGTLVNAAVAAAGFAEAVAFDDNTRFLDAVNAGVQEARSTGLGLWAPSPAC